LLAEARRPVVSSRHSPRNRFVAGELHRAGLGTLLFDLLTDAEEADRGNVFDIGLLAGRLLAEPPRQLIHPSLPFSRSRPALARPLATAQEALGHGRLHTQATRCHAPIRLPHLLNRRVNSSLCAFQRTLRFRVSVVI
jgi:hypothetical protein